MKRLAVLTGGLAFAFLLSSYAQAEMYVAAEFGYTIPNDFSGVTGNGLFSGGNFSDLKLKNSLEYGARIGYFLPDSWLGFEVEGFNTNPDIKEQTVSVNGTSMGTAPGTHFRVTTLAFNVVARAKHRPLQPYVGVGPGVFFARASNLFGTPGFSSSDTAVGLNAFVGARYFVTNNLAVFGEYKYNRASFSFSNFGGAGFGIDGTYSANIFSAGVSYHFK